MKRLIKLSILILGIICLSDVLGQQFSLRQYAVVDGLPQSQVNVVIEDANGYLWIGTHGGGLARFDGKEFKVYTTRDGLLSNIVHFLKIDSHNNLWIVHPRGLSRFNGLDFKKFNQPDSSFTLRRVRRIFEHRDTVYLVNGQGMLGAIHNDSLHFWGKPVISNKIILYTHLMPTRDVALYLNDSSIMIKSTKKDYIVSHAKYFNRALNIFNYQGKMWFLTDLGYYYFNPDDQVFAQGALDLRNHIIQYDSAAHSFWTRSEMDLLKEYELDGIHHIDTVLHNISVTQILKDSEGNVWLGTAGNGLYKYFIQDFDRCASRSLSDVKAITIDAAGASWIGSEHGIWRMQKGKIKKFKSSGFNDSDIYSISVCPDEEVWVASYNGLGRYDRTEDEFKWYTRNDGISSMYINAVDHGENGEVWFGTNGGGAGFFNGEKFTHFSVDEGLPSRNVTALRYLLSNKTIYIGSEYGLVSIHNKTISPIDIPEFTNTTIQSINIYKDSLLLVGSGGAGLAILNPTTKQKRVLNVMDGLPSDFIYFVAADAEGVIWVGTEQGINRLKLDVNHEITENLHFGFDNGLEGVQTNQNAFYLGEEKYFGLIDGIYQYNDLRKAGWHSFDLHLTDIEIFYGQYESRHFAESVAGFFKIPTKLRLPPDKNHITFSFNRVDKRYPKSVRFKYFLENYDKTWSKPSAVGRVTFGNLPPGDYILNVLATNNQGSWDKIPLMYSFTVSAPFYQNAIFQATTFVLIGSLITLFVLFRIRYKVRKAIEVEHIRNREQEKLRKEIARDFHDEMGNQLTRIINYVSLIKLNGNGVGSELYNKVEDSAKYLYSGTRDFIWSIDPSNDELSKLFLHIRDFGEKLFEEKGISFRANNDVRSSVNVPYGFSREANLIFKEAMTNVFNHSQAKNVTFSLSKTDDQYELKLDDDGIGFDAVNSSRTNGLKNMQTRTDRIRCLLSIESNPERGGTSISLLFQQTKQRKHVKRNKKKSSDR